MAWEYETLFDVEQFTPMDEAYWRIQKADITAGTMGYRTETLKAGRRLEATVYARFGREDEKRLRAIKQNETPMQVAAYNRERSIRHMIQLMDANFGETDIKMDLTYAGQEPTWDQCEKDTKKFLRKVRRLRKKMELPDLKYIYVTEDADEDGNHVRPHAHLTMSGGIDLLTLKKIWEKGLARADYLEPTREGLEGWTRYMVKSQRRKGKRKWHASRNLTQPSVRISDTKFSNAKVRKLAHGFENEAKEICEKLYKGYDFIRCTVRYSDYTDGVMLRILMWKRKEGGDRKCRALKC